MTGQPMPETLLLTEAAWRIAQRRDEILFDLALDGQCDVEEFRSSSGSRMVRVSAHCMLLEMACLALDAAAADPSLPGPTRHCARWSGRDCWGQMASIDRGETTEQRRHRLAL